MVINLQGYHGTDIANKDDILKNGFKYKKFNKNLKDNKIPCDLGNGVYFYISSEFLPSPSKNAIEYAKLYPRPSKNVVVFKCEIEVEEDKLLNLNDLESAQIIYDYYITNKEVIDLVYESIKESGAKKRGFILGLVIEMFIYKNKLSIDAIQKNTSTNFKLSKVNNLFLDLPNGTELVIKNKKCIKSKEIYGGEWDEYKFKVIEKIFWIDS